MNCPRCGGESARGRTSQRVHKPGGKQARGRTSQGVNQLGTVGKSARGRTSQGQKSQGANPQWGEKARHHCQISALFLVEI